MPDLGNTTVFSQTDASNASGTAPSWSGSAAPSTLDDAGRALQGAVTREWNWRSYTVTAGGSGTAMTLTYSVAPAAYYNGQRFSFLSLAVTGSCTLNVNALGAKTIKKDISGTLTNLASGDISSGMFVEVAYNTSNDCFVWVNRGALPTLGALASLDTVGTAQIDALAVTGAKIAANTIDGTKIALGSDAQGDIMYYDGTDWARLAAGTSGYFLKTQGAGANPTWAAQSASTYTLLGTITTTSGASQALGSLTLTNYKFLRLVFNAVSHNGGASQGFTVNSVQVANTMSAAQPAYGVLDIDLSTGAGSSGVSREGGTPWGGANTGVTTATTTITVAPTGGASFDAGSILVYAI